MSWSPASLMWARGHQGHHSKVTGKLGRIHVHVQCVTLKELRDLQNTK